MAKYKPLKLKSGSEIGLRYAGLKISLLINGQHTYLSYEETMILSAMLLGAGKDMAATYQKLNSLGLLKNIEGARE